MGDLLANSWVYTWIVIPLLIFVARVIDVSMGTVRVIFVSRGLKYLAPVVGFFEILIWLLAIGQINGVAPLGLIKEIAGGRGGFLLPIAGEGVRHGEVLGRDPVGGPCT